MVERIEKLEDGKVIAYAARDAEGYYCCLPEGQTLTKFQVRFRTLDEVARFLTADRTRTRVRMNPKWIMAVDGIHIDGVPREQLMK